ncbi:MAG: hypothetical protein GDA42_11160 [Ekhidna sp.]|nr:hypothetical protein [Ekhidna sp.]MBC6410992.1 hypothetical protein [Ekhidna sp.]
MQNQALENQLSMLEQTNAYLDDHTAIWINVPVINQYKNKIHQITIAIEKMLKNKPRIHTGQNILHLKKQIADKMDILDDTLEAYADDIGDESLRQQANNHYTDYFRLTYDNFLSKVVSVIDLLEANIENMADHGIVQDQIDDVKLNLDEYQISLDKEPTYDLSKKLANHSIDEYLGEAEEFADKLDKVMKRFKRSQVTFYNGYLAARTVIEY